MGVTLLTTGYCGYPQYGPIMAKAPSFSPLQLFSPIQLIFCLILFFLPWIELQCSLPPELLKDAPKSGLESMKKDGVDPSKPISMLTQSGLQIATGGSSPSSDMEKFSKSMAKGMGGEPQAKSSAKKNKDDDVKGAPLMYLFPVALIAGIVLGCLPWQSLARRLILAGCCMGAFGVVGLQALMGFPMEKEIAKQKDQMKGMGGMGGLGGAPPKGKTDTKEKEPEIFRVAWKIPLYLTLLLLLGAGATAFIDGGSLGGKKKTKRPVYDDDDDEEEEVEEDEEEEERPKKKKKPVVEELPDDEEEEEKPKKKKRRDADD